MTLSLAIRELMPGSFAVNFSEAGFFFLFFSGSCTEHKHLPILVNVASVISMKLRFWYYDAKSNSLSVTD